MHELCYQLFLRNFSALIFEIWSQLSAGSADGTQVACSASNNLIKLYDVAT